MLVVIEGVDVTGKTTLARELADLTNGVIMHAGKPDGHPLADYEAMIDWYKPVQDDLILDRWHVGEYVWPTIFNRKTEFTKPVQRHVELFMLSRGALLVYAERSPGVLGPLLNASDEPLKSDQLQQALQLFEDALLVGAHRGEVYSWDIDNPRLAAGDLVKYAKALEAEVAAVHAVTADWIGNPKPRVLLVGDQLGPPKRNVVAPVGIPFAPYLATSGHYLMDALHETLWRDVAIVNSKVDYTDELTDVPALCAALGGPAVVALGGNASRALSEQGIYHETVPHPQWWRRFKHHERELYADVIRLAAGC